MGRKAKGTVYRQSDSWRVRLTLGKKRPTFALGDDEKVARQRAELLAELAQKLRKAGHLELAPRLLEAAASAADPTEAAETVERLCAGKLKVRCTDAMTFQELGELWTSGELHRRYPDHVKKKRTANRDAQLFRARLYPIVGHVRLKEFRLDHAEAAMRVLPKELSQASRRQHAQLLSRVLSLAAYPVGVIERSPLPRGFVPPQRSRKAKSFLYPAEDRLLMACEDIPLAARLMWGLLAREGMRHGEARQLRWADLNLERGAVRLDTTKTDEPRVWALDEGVVAALRAWKALQRPKEDSEAVFSQQLKGHAAVAFRRHLERAGVDRVELFEGNKNRLAIRVHDLRSTFITLALANGKTEAWVADRTGHRSSTMINTYRRTARHAQELGLRPLDALDKAIPELRIVRESSDKPLAKSDGDVEDDEVPTESRGGGIGIRRRLKIARGNTCGFESRPRHHILTSSEAQTRSDVHSQLMSGLTDGNVFRHAVVVEIGIDLEAAHSAVSVRVAQREGGAEEHAWDRLCIGIQSSNLLKRNTHSAAVKVEPTIEKVCDLAEIGPVGKQAESKVHVLSHAKSRTRAEVVDRLAPKTRALVRQSMLIVAVHTQRHVVVGVGESDSSACRKERRESEFGARLSNHFTGRLAGAGAQHVFNSRGRLNQHRGRAERDPDSKLGVQHHLHTGAERRTQSTRGAHTRKRSEGGRIADRNARKLPGASYRDVETCQRHSEKEPVVDAMPNTQRDVGFGKTLGDIENPLAWYRASGDEVAANLVVGCVRLEHTKAETRACIERAYVRYGRRHDGKFRGRTVGRRTIRREEKSRRLMDSDVVGRARYVEGVLLRANNAGGVVPERRTVVGDRSDRAAHQGCVITDQNPVVVARVCGRRAKKQN